MFRRQAPPPDWAPFANARDWREFERIVGANAGARGWTGDIREGSVTDGEGRFGLVNLAQMCADQPRKAWPELIHEHLEACARMDDRVDFDNRGEARVALRARLYDDAFLATLEHPPVTRRVSEDLQLVLAFDFPDRVTVAPREDVLKWGPEDELFELALEQTRAERDLELDRIDLPVEGSSETVSVFALFGDSFFTATHALWADEFDPPASEHGTLVAVPTRHAVLAHPIRDDGVISAIGHMIGLAHDFAAQGPGTLSTHLYWIRDGVWERQATAFEGVKDSIAPGPGFIELLNELA